MTPAKALRLTTLGLAVALVAFGSLLVGLARVFWTELDDANAALGAQRDALTRHAEAELVALFNSRLEAARPRIEQARTDPFVDDHGVLLVEHGQRVVPAARHGTLQTATHALACLEQIERVPLSETACGLDDARDLEDPWARRVALLRELTPGAPAAKVEKTVRGILSERALHRLGAERDVPFVIAVLERLDAHFGGANPTLVRMLLRDGVPTAPGGPLAFEGLQRQLLMQRTQLDADDVRGLCSSVAALSKRHHLETDAFEQACRIPENDTAIAVDSVTAPQIRDGWWLVPDGDRVYGVQVPEDVMVGEVAQRLREKNLLERDDRLKRHGPESGLILISPRLERARHAASQRLSLKLGLLGISGLLAIALSALAVVFQRRRLRYVQLKSEFVSTVTHELRTPLASLRVMAETLQHRLEGDPKAKDYPERLVREVDGLSALVENILSFNRLEKGKWQAQRQPVDLGTLRAALEEDAAQYTAAPVQLSFENFEGTLHADPELFRLLLLNLLRNACRYNERSPVTVAFTASREHDRFVLRVRDNGVGIPNDHHERVFAELDRPKLPRGRGGPGSGLGLALCRRIAELHGGSMRVESSSPEGTTFRVELGSAHRG